ncbi:MAG: GlcG/HbpS family heme-binding protein [Croceibacterium sp.]
MRLYATCAALAVAALASPVPSAAQTARPMLDYATAAKVRDGCLSWAAEKKLTVAVAVYDEAGRLITFAIADGTPTAVAEFAMWKGRSAATVHVASKDTANWGRGPAFLATWEGGTPIFSPDGTALGGVGVSGAESSDDTACGQAGIAAAGMRSTAN